MHLAILDQESSEETRFDRRLSDQFRYPRLLLDSHPIYFRNVDAGALIYQNEAGED